MKHLIIGGSVAAVLLATAGCSGSGAPSGGAASYMTANNSKVAFIQWRTASHGHLHGMITEYGIGGSAPAQTVSINSERFIGTMKGNSVTLKFAALYFLHSSAHGTLDGGVLTMWVPQSDGTVRQMSFSQANKAGHDRAIAALHRTVRHANLLVAKQQASQRQRPANAQAAQSSQTALSRLYRASSLASGGMLADGLARLADHLHAARAHLAREKNDAMGDNKYCAAALTVGGDAKAVDGAFMSVQGDALSLMSDISNIRYDVTTENALLRHLKKAGATVPDSASQVIASASANLKPTIAKANYYIDQINTIDARARSIANNMATRKCSGAKNGTILHPIPHIR
jgi:hypothetical protein